MKQLAKTVIQPQPGVTLQPTREVTLPTTGYLRLRQIVGRKPRDTDPGSPALIPVSEHTLWVWIKAGKFPKPVKLGENTTAWRVEDVRHYMERVGGSP